MNIPSVLNMKSQPSFIHPPPMASTRSLPASPVTPSPGPNLSAPSPSPRLRYPTNSVISTTAPTPVDARNTPSSIARFFLVNSLKSIAGSLYLKISSANGSAPKKCVMWSHCIPTGDMLYHPNIPHACNKCPSTSSVNIGSFILSTSYIQ